MTAYIIHQNPRIQYLIRFLKSKHISVFCCFLRPCSYETRIFFTVILDVVRSYFYGKKKKNERTKNSPSALKLDRSNSWFYVRHPIYITHKEGNFVATSKPSALLQRISRLPTQVVSRWRVNNLLNPISSHFARWRGKINLISPKYLSWREKKEREKNPKK